MPYAPPGMYSLQFCYEITMFYLRKKFCTVGSGVILLDYWLYSQSSVIMEAWPVTELSYTFG